MADAGPDGFARAVAAALDELGTGLLGRPREFAGAVADLHDPESPEMAVLYAQCSGELLGPYTDAARRGAVDALEQAARRGELWLHDVRRVRDKWRTEVCSRLAWTNLRPRSHSAPTAAVRSRVARARRW